MKANEPFIDSVSLILQEKEQLNGEVQTEVFPVKLTRQADQPTGYPFSQVVRPIQIKEDIILPPAPLAEVAALSPWLIAAIIAFILGMVALILLAFQHNVILLFVLFVSLFFLSAVFAGLAIIQIKGSNGGYAGIGLAWIMCIGILASMLGLFLPTIIRILSGR